jgi:NitT/TauT family transport system substrate-binding protein
VFADLTTVAGTRASLGVLFPSSTVFMDSARIKAHPEFAQHLANAFVRTLAFINSHSAEEIMALLPDAAFGKQPDRVAYLAALKETKAMFDNDGRMPADGARREWEVLSAFDPRYKSVRVEQTYTNRFADEALRRYAKAAP